MLAAQRGQAERAVLVVVAGGVLLAAGPEHAEVEHPHAGGQHPVPGQARLGQPVDHGGPHVGQAAAQVQHPVVLHPVPGRPPVVVVAVLAAPGGVHADRLDVPVRVGADPDVLPGRRDDQRLDPGDLRRVGDRRRRRCRGS